MTGRRQILEMLNRFARKNQSVPINEEDPDQRAVGVFLVGGA